MPALPTSNYSSEVNEVSITSYSAIELYDSIESKDDIIYLDVRNEENHQLFMVEGPNDVEMYNIPYFDFMEDPEGAAGGTYLYWTYDRLGRPLENGYLTGSFDRKTLTAKATEAPGWPATPDTWRKRQHWDGTDPAANAIGRLTQVETSQSDEGTSASRDSYRYDLFGNTVQIRQAVTGVSGDRQTDYAFDAQGSPLAVQYPRDIEGTRWRLSYRYDALGRVSTISQGETGNEELIRYAYRADGRPEAEQRPGDGSTPSDREYAYNPPLWPTRARIAAKSGVC